MSDPATSSPPGPPRRRRARWLIGIAALLLAAAIAWGSCGFGGCPDVSRLRAYQPGGATLLLDRNGEPFADLAPVRGSLVSLDDLPDHVPAAFIAVEDQRFYKHRGVDIWRIGGAIRRNMKTGGFAEGFSTITMQLARNVFPDEIRMKERTVWRKLLEMRVALEIEGRYTKKAILELYLNHIYFGNGARGIEAAARHYFRREAKDLTLAQSALLAALIMAPTNYDPRRHPDDARERRNLVITLMEKQGVVTKKEADAARKSGLGVRAASSGRRPEDRLAGYFVEEIRRILEERYGDRLYSHPLRVWTTLDVRMQEAAQVELAKQLAAIEDGRYGRFTGPRYVAGREFAAGTTRYLQGAVVSLDVQTGDVLAWVGGRDFNQSQFDRVGHATRQAGSAFKPFVFASALAEGHPLSEFLEDEPLKLELARGKYWEPKNFSGHYEGRISLRDALVKSINVATVRLADQVGYRRISATARRAGIASDIALVPSMALGTVAVSPLELTSAYTAFAGLGTRSIPRLLTRVETADGERLWTTTPRQEEALDPAIAYLINDTLRDALERGSGAPALKSGFTGPASGKTGTSNDGVDAWFIGYTPEVVTGVWVGFDHPQRIVPGASGGRLAAPVWGRIMSRWYRGHEPPWWPAPRNVVQHQVDPETGLILEEGCRPDHTDPYTELFIRGTEPASSCPEREYDYDSWDEYSRPYGSDSTWAEGYGASDWENGDTETPDRFDEDSQVLPDVEPSPEEPERGEPSPSREADSIDLNGWWDVANTVDASSLSEYEGLRLDYRIFLSQDGTTVSGEGEKWAENGRRTTSSGRMSISLTGEIVGHRLRLDFTEYGSRRTTTGWFDYDIRDGGNAMDGTFRSTAASSRGHSSARRVL
jgi:penicillin-binding protein 1A